MQGETKCGHKLLFTAAGDIVRMSGATSLKLTMFYGLSKMIEVY